MKSNPELLISPRQAREQYLRSYSLSEIYNLLFAGRIRGVYEQRGSRRKWSIPVSAILEFQQSLIPSTQQARERGVRPDLPTLEYHTQPGRRAISLVKGGSV